MDGTGDVLALSIPLSRNGCLQRGESVIDVLSNGTREGINPASLSFKRGILFFRFFLLGLRFQLLKLRLLKIIHATRLMHAVVSSIRAVKYTRAEYRDLNVFCVMNYSIYT